MRVQKPRVSLLFHSAVDELKAAGAVILPEDYVWLHNSAKKAVDGGGSDCPAFIDIPVTVDDVTLWPLTLGASIWWQQYGEEWYKGDKSTEVIAIAFCMAHAKNPEVFRYLNSKLKADIALVKWQAGIGSKCTVNQLAWAIDKVNKQYDYIEINSANEAKVDSQSSADWGIIIAKLCGAYHMEPDYFLWKLSQQAAIDMLVNAPVPFGYEKDHDAQASKYFGQFREVVAHIKNRSKV